MKVTSWWMMEFFMNNNRVYVPNSSESRKHVMNDVHNIPYVGCYTQNLSPACDNIPSTDICPKISNLK